MLFIAEMSMVGSVLVFCSAARLKDVFIVRRGTTRILLLKIILSEFNSRTRIYSEIFETQSNHLFLKFSFETYPVVSHLGVCKELTPVINYVLFYSLTMYFFLSISDITFLCINCQRRNSNPNVTKKL